MSNIGNKQTMAKNLRFYIEKSGKDRKELAQIWGFPYSTLTEWVNGRKYPRIDRIEIMADYFGILKSDLIEERTKEREEVQKKADTITNAVLKMKMDSDFLSLVEKLMQLDSDKIKGVDSMLAALLK